MNNKSSILDVNEAVCNADFIEWEKLRNKTVFVTGATGLIGYTLITSLLYSSKKRDLNIKIVALVRNYDKAKKRFQDVNYTDENLSFILGTIEKKPIIDEKIDFIVHGASKTASADFINEPVETLETAVLGTMNILKLAKENNVSGIVYLSSMEVYGYPIKGHKVIEDDIGLLSPLKLRNSYPIGKIQSEALCLAYAKEYCVPTMIARLTQTFGPGIDRNDKRIFAYFGRCAADKENIILKTRGETERSYCYTSDAATAILTILLSGNPGEIYNVADERTYCSISEMAEGIAKENGIKVVYDIQDEENLSCYLDTLYMNLDVTKLRSLGWTAKFKGGTSEMIYRMMNI